MQLGIEVLLKDKKKLAELKKKRVALICHPASVDSNLVHSMDLLSPKIKLTAAFGPQHGVKGEKQDNMVETEDAIDPKYKIPVFSLYGQVRRPTKSMMDTFDIALFDLQDLGCRIYTFITTLLYVMEECARYDKTLWVLDRPNPIGREVEGLTLIPGYESFVGATPIPIRHGLTVGELALYYKDLFNLKLDLKIIKMKGYSFKKPGFGWPMERSWVNPSPNAQTLNMARAFPGTVLLEGTQLSEGRGTTRALEVVGAPQLKIDEILAQMKKLAPQWLKGCVLRECYFEPTFHKHQHQLCHGLHIHADGPTYNPKTFKPYRIMALFLKALRTVHPGYEIYRDFPYEYVTDKLAFDVINGGPYLREWIDNPKSKISDLEARLKLDESKWMKISKKYYLY